MNDLIYSFYRFMNRNEIIISIIFNSLVFFFQQDSTRISDMFRTIENSLSRSFSIARQRSVGGTPRGNRRKAREFAREESSVPRRGRFVVVVVVVRWAGHDPGVS